MNDQFVLTDDELMFDRLNAASKMQQCSNVLSNNNRHHSVPWRNNALAQRSVSANGTISFTGSHMHE